MNFGTYEIISLGLVALVISGIKFMGSPKTARIGNQLGAVSMLCAIVLVLVHNDIIGIPLLIVAILIGGAIGTIMAMRVKMTQMPQLIALFNGLGGGASMFVALVVIFEGYYSLSTTSRISSQLALLIGALTLSGSLIAAGKLDRRISQRPVIIKGHTFLCLSILTISLALSLVFSITNIAFAHISSLAVVILSLFLGVLITIRIGGADMPITISLLNSFSGLAASVCGFTISDPLLVAVGAIVGSAGLVLTRIMCKAMNRSLVSILFGTGTVQVENELESMQYKDIEKSCEIGMKEPQRESSAAKEKLPPEEEAAEVLKKAGKIIIVPGYGMAISQAQWQVRKLFDNLEEHLKKEVKFAIHPVAGRMPGHMNVLLAEVGIPYEKLNEMDIINPEFKETDAAVVVGACDVINTAAATAVGTPIYGMPILKVAEAKKVIVCNIDTNPGYSGIANPLYKKENVILLFGEASETLENLNNMIMRE